MLQQKVLLSETKKKVLTDYSTIMDAINNDFNLKLLKLIQEKEHANNTFETATKEKLLSINQKLALIEALIPVALAASQTNGNGNMNSNSNAINNYNVADLISTRNCCKVNVNGNPNVNPNPIAIPTTITNNNSNNNNTNNVVNNVVNNTKTNKDKSDKNSERRNKTKSEILDILMRPFQQNDKNNNNNNNNNKSEIDSLNTSHPVNQHNIDNVSQSTISTNVSNCSSNGSDATNGSNITSISQATTKNSGMCKVFVSSLFFSFLLVYFLVNEQHINTAACHFI